MEREVKPSPAAALPRPDRDGGSSLAEVLAALVILSLMSLPLVSLIQQTVAPWSHVADLGAAVTSAEVRLANAYRIEASIKGAASNPTAKPAEPLGHPRLDKPSTCQFDIVGRRCRN